MPHGAVDMEESSLDCFSQQTVPRTLKHGTPTDIELEELGDEIVEKWKKLGRRLDVSDPELQEIDRAHVQLPEKGYQMLKHWKQEKGPAATYQALCDALQHKLVQRQDLAVQFCYINGPLAIQQPADPVPERRVTGEISGATAGTHASGDSTGVRSALKRKRAEPDPERGILSWKIHCVSATSRNSEEQDPQEQSEQVNRYMRQKAGDVLMKGTFDLSSFEGLEEYYAYLRGRLSLVVEGLQKSSIKITVKCCNLEILEGLWNYYCSGRLNAVAEKCLITEKVKDELGMETIKLTTTILKEDYLACKLSLMEISGSTGDGQIEPKKQLESREQELVQLGEPTEAPEEELTEHQRDTGSSEEVAKLTSNMADLQQTKEHYERALGIDLKKLGPENVDVARTYFNLGVAQRGLGNLQQAKEYSERALDIRLKMLGPEHVDVMRTYNNLGVVQRDMGNLQQAKEYYELALDSGLKKLGPENVDVARTYINLGVVQHDMGNLQQAKECYELALDIRLKKLGPEHTDVARTYFDLGVVQRDMGNLQQAKEYYERAVDIRQKKLGPEHFDVATTYINLGVVQRDMGNLQQAKEYCERALDIKLKKLGSEHVDVARTYINLGLVQHDLGNLQDAMQYYERALDMELKMLGPEHFDVAHTYFNLGVVQHDMGNLQQAEEYYKRALDIQLKRLGPKHIDVALTYSYLGVVQRYLGNQQQAEEYCELALDITLEKLGAENIEVEVEVINSNLAVVRR